MVRYVTDATGRFPQRPHYTPEELDRECESIITRFLKGRYGDAQFPVTTDDLTLLVERDTQDLDLYADLSEYGPDVEGLTEFHPGAKPAVKISAQLAGDERRGNRLRTTLTHEYGHVHFHAYLWELDRPSRGLFSPDRNAAKQICKRDTIINATQTDWMEWQAGYVCGALLMPLSHVRRLVGEYQETHALYGVVGQDSEHARSLIDAVQNRFQVSGEAARVRLLKLNVLGATTAGPSLFNP